MMDFTRDYILENKTVRLAPLAKGDVHHLAHFSTEEPEIWKYSLTQPDTPQKMKIYIDSALDGRRNKNTYAFSVYDKNTNRYAGSTRFYGIRPEEAALQLGYTWYGKEFRGTGINQNCKYLLLEFAFDTLKMERVEFRADKDNQRSINAMKKIGCIVEGILRSNTYKPDGERRDSIVLSILKKEWNNTVKKQLGLALQH